MNAFGRRHTWVCCVDFRRARALAIFSVGVVFWYVRVYFSAFKRCPAAFGVANALALMHLICVRGRARALDDEWCQLEAPSILLKDLWMRAFMTDTRARVRVRARFSSQIAHTLNTQKPLVIRRNVCADYVNRGRL